MITIYTKDIGDVKEKRCDGDYVSGLEDFNEDYIKRELKL